MVIRASDGAAINIMILIREKVKHFKLTTLIYGKNRLNFVYRESSAAYGEVWDTTRKTFLERPSFYFVTFIWDGHGSGLRVYPCPEMYFNVIIIFIT